MRTDDALSRMRRDVARAGGEVAWSGVVQALDGPVPVMAVDVPDAEAKMRLLVERMRAGAEDPDIVELAQRLRRMTRGAGDPAEYAWTWVRQNIRFVPEAGERFQGARYTAGIGAGDCDCQVILLGAVAMAGGARVRPVPFFRDGEDMPAHVAQRLRDSKGRWRWAETTIPARWDEHPVLAARRLRVERPDIVWSTR